MLIIMPLWFSSCPVQRLAFVLSKYLSLCLSTRSPLLFLNFCRVQLSHFSVTLCKSPSARMVGRGDPACKAARPVPASGSMMVMVVHGQPPSEVTKHDRCDSHVKHWERGVLKQSGTRLSVSLRSLIHGGGPVRQHEIKLSSCCRLYTTVRLERDKQCLGGRVHACGWNSGLWGFVAQRSL